MRHSFHFTEDRLHISVWKVVSWRAYLPPSRSLLYTVHALRGSTKADTALTLFPNRPLMALSPTWLRVPAKFVYGVPGQERREFCRRFRKGTRFIAAGHAASRFDFVCFLLLVRSSGTMYGYGGLLRAREDLNSSGTMLARSLRPAVFSFRFGVVKFLCCFVGEQSA